MAGTHGAGPLMTGMQEMFQSVTGSAMPPMPPEFMQRMGMPPGTTAETMLQRMGWSEELTASTVQSAARAVQGTEETWEEARNLVKTQCHRCVADACPDGHSLRKCARCQFFYYCSKECQARRCIFSETKAVL